MLQNERDELLWTALDAQLSKVLRTFPEVAETCIALLCTLADHLHRMRVAIPSYGILSPAQLVGHMRSSSEMSHIYVI